MEERKKILSGQVSLVVAIRVISGRLLTGDPEESVC